MRPGGRERPSGETLVMSRTLLALALFSPGAARAEEPVAGERYRLQWQREDGAESCVSGAVLSRLLEQVLGARPSPAGSAGSFRVLLEGVARPAAPPLRFSVRVTVRDARNGELFGERELTTAEAQCSVLTPPLLLVLAMSVDPDAGRDGLPQAVSRELQQGNGESAPEASSPVVAREASSPIVASPPAPLAAKASPATEPAHPAEAHPAPVTQAGSDVNEPRVFGALAAGSEILPSLALGAGFGARLALRRRWSMSFSVFGWNPQAVALPNSAFLQEDRVQVAAGQLAASLCRPLVESRLRLGVCAGFGAGLRWVWARALVHQDNPTRAFFGPELGLEGSWRFAPGWFLSAGATTQVELRRDRFIYRDHRDQPRPWFDPGALVSRFWLSLEASL